MGTTTDTGTQVCIINGLNPFDPVLGDVRLGSIVFTEKGSAAVYFSSDSTPPRTRSTPPRKGQSTINNGKDTDGMTFLPK